MLRLTERADLGVMYDAEAARLRQAADTGCLQVVTRDTFLRFYEGCPSVGFESDGVPIGGILFDGEQAHIAVLPSHGRERAIGFWTDARNGRSSRNQAGRNPICEQSDVFLDTFDPLSRGSGGDAGALAPFLVTPCPSDAVGPRQG